MDIIYQDAHYVAINKPAGLLVHRSAIDRHESRFALQLVRDQLGRRVYPVHRLDKPTSGVLLFALNPEAACRMTEQFAAGAVRKTYLAVVRGHTAPSGIIDYPLREELDSATDGRADPDKPAQPAISAYERLATTELAYPVGRYATARYSLLRVSPRTGRKHQIRRHLKHIAHPIIGDTTHGDGRHNLLWRAELNCDRLMLAATRLVFEHPFGGVETIIDADVGPAWRCVFDRLGWGLALQ